MDIGTTAANFPGFPQLDGAIGSGPTPDIRLLAEATGRDLRVMTTIEHFRSCDAQQCNGVSIDNSIWSASWNTSARATSSDSITISGPPALDGVSASFFLPIELSGQIVLDQDFLFGFGTQPTFGVGAVNNGNTVASLQRSYPNTWSRLRPPVDITIDESIGLVIPFTFGDAFLLNSSFSSSISAFIASNTNWFELTRFIASSDFGSTAHFDPFTNFLFDSDNDGTPDTALDPAALQISSSLGIDYLAATTAVPVPAAWVMLLGGLAMLRGARKGDRAAHG